MPGPKEAKAVEITCTAPSLYDPETTRDGADAPSDSVSISVVSPDGGRTFACRVEERAAHAVSRFLQILVEDGMVGSGAESPESVPCPSGGPAALQAVAWYINFYGSVCPDNKLGGPAATRVPRPFVSTFVPSGVLSKFELVFASEVLPPLLSHAATPTAPERLWFKVRVAVGVMRIAAFLQIPALEMLASLSLRFHPTLAETALQLSEADLFVSPTALPMVEDTFFTATGRTSVPWPLVVSVCAPDEAGDDDDDVGASGEVTLEEDAARPEIDEGLYDRYTWVERRSYCTLLPGAALEATVISDGTSASDAVAALQALRGVASVHRVRWLSNISSPENLTGFLKARKLAKTWGAKWHGRITVTLDVGEHGAELTAFKARDLSGVSLVVRGVKALKANKLALNADKITFGPELKSFTPMALSGCLAKCVDFSACSIDDFPVPHNTRGHLVTIIPPPLSTMTQRTASGAKCVIDYTGSTQLKIVPSYAFHGSGFASVILPPQLTSFGPHAFDGCIFSALDLLACPQLARLEAACFKNYNGTGSGLRGLTFPPLLTHVGPGCFELCQVNVDLSQCESLTEIPADCFLGFSGSKVLLPKSIVRLGERSFMSSRCRVDLSQCDISEIPKLCFSQSAGNITLPPSLQHIGAQAFQGGCACLVNLPSCAHLTSIGDRAFENSATAVEAPASVVSIGQRAFASCRGRIDLRLCSGLTAAEGSFVQAPSDRVRLPPALAPKAESLSMKLCDYIRGARRK